MSKVKTQPCPECGGEMRFQKGADAITYHGHERTLRTLGWWCSKCGEALFDGDALRARERAFLELKVEVDGVLGPEEVAEVRTALGLSQRKAGELLGGGPGPFRSTSRASRPSVCP